MSVDLRVMFAASAMPSLAEWSSAVVGAGFEVEIVPDVELVGFSGFLPCNYKGTAAGFEYYREASPLDGLTQLGLSVDVYDDCITFSTRSDYREFATSMICAAVLCSVTQGVLVDADGETLVPADRAVAWAREGEEGIQTDIAEQEAYRASPQVPGMQQLSRPWWKFW